MKFFSFLLLFFSLNLSAQVLTSETPYDLTATLAKPFSLPLQFDLKGRLSLSLGSGASTVIPIYGHGGWNWQNYEFIPFVHGLTDDWVEAGPEIRKMKVKQHRVEIGAGIGIAQKLLFGQLAFTAGLVPYKGASFETRVFKKPSRGWWALPLSHEEWAEWEVGEGRDYEMYGGMTFLAGVSLSFVMDAQVYRTSQERWSLSLEKLSDRILRIKVRQDTWKKRGRIFGPAVATFDKAAVEYFDMERSYLLDMLHPQGPEILKSIWKGRLIELQSSVASREDEASNRWLGEFRSRYLGIPFIYGRTNSRVELESWDVDRENRLIHVLNLQQENNGVIRNRDPQVWTVVHDPRSDKLIFLALSQSIDRGMKGVKRELGTWLDRMGFKLSWPERGLEDFMDARLVFSFKLESLLKLLEHSPELSDYQTNCVTYKLSCKRLSKARKTLRDWDKLRDQGDEFKPVQVAEYLIKHPLLWGMLLHRMEENLRAEFIAHSQRYMPMQKNLSSHGVSAPASLE